MGIRRSRLNNLFFILFLVAFISCNQKEYSSSQINLEKVRYDEALIPNAALGTFNPHRHIFPVTEKNSVIGMPDSLSEAKIRHSFIYRDQYFYYAYKSGIWTEEGFNSMRPPIDPAKQTDQWVDCIATVGFGKDSNGEWVVILDRNNNEDLNDDSPVKFTLDTLSFGGTEFILNRARLNLTFEIYRDGTISAHTEPFILAYDPAKGISSLGLSYDKYLRGEWKTGDQTFHVALFSFGYKAIYEPQKYTYLLIDLNKDEEFDVMPGSNESYHTNELFNIAGISWKIDSIKSNGTRIYLSKTDSTVLPKFAIRKGAIAPNFKAQSLSGSELELSDFKGKYVLLDFWGTWCGPCVEEIPNLKKAYVTFSDKNFEIIGICTDRNPQLVRAFVEERNIGWSQIFEKFRSDEMKINNLYDVTGYPTQYLINPEGEIIAHGLELRGEQLHQMLESVLD